jgi:hypothetical protein
LEAVAQKPRVEARCIEIAILLGAPGESATAPLFEMMIAPGSCASANEDRGAGADSAGDEGAQGLTGRSLHVANQHDIAVRCTAIHYQLLAVWREVETLDEFAVEVSHLFGRRTRNRLAPDVRNATLESDV